MGGLGPSISGQETRRGGLGDKGTGRVGPSIRLFAALRATQDRRQGGGIERFGE
jgi:hypothetical protein